MMKQVLIINFNRMGGLAQMYLQPKKLFRW